MAVRALKQTGSRNIEAALEYISKMSYLDPRNELIVRVIKQTSPGTNTDSVPGHVRCVCLVVVPCCVSLQEKLACQTPWTIDLH